MQSLLLLATLALPVTTETRTSQHQPGWVDLPTPPPLVYHSHIGSNPQQEAIYEYAYSLVDHQGKITAMSPATTVIGQHNYTINVRIPETTYTQACGYILWSRRTGGSSDLGPAGTAELEWRPNGVNRMEQPKPFLPVSGWSDHLLQARSVQPSIRWYYGNFNERYEDLAAYPRSTILEAPSKPPEIELNYLPNCSYDFCYTWIGNVGESKPSPILTVEKQSGVETTNNPIVLIKPGCPPQGALGFYLYMRKKGETGWHRQYRRQFMTTSYCNNIAQYKVQIDRFTPSMIEPSKHKGRSYLTSLQKAIESTSDSIIVDTPQVICSPIVMPFRHGTSMKRTVSTASGAAWKLQTKTTAGDDDSVTGFPTDWPMWVETSQYTRLVGCNMQSHTAESGIEFLSYDGSTCFHFRAERCSISLWRSLFTDKYTAAIRQLYSIEGAHTCSEPVFKDCELWARHCVVCEGNQSANWYFHTLTATSPGGLDSSIFTLNNSGSFVVDGRFTTDGARSMIVAANVRQVDISQWYTDRGFPCWFNFCTPNTASTINIQVNQINHWPTSSGSSGDWSWFHVAEAPQSGSGKIFLNITGTSANHQNHHPNGTPMNGNGPTSHIFCPRYGGVHYHLPNNSLLSQLSLHELSLDWWSNNGTEFYDPAQGMVWKTYRHQWDNHTDASKPVIHSITRPVSTITP